MKKGMTVITTSPALYKALHGRNCRQDHAHQPIEGSTWTHGYRINRSSFSETYHIPESLLDWLLRLSSMPRGNGLSTGIMG